MEFKNRKHIISVLGITFFIFLAVGSVDDDEYDVELEDSWALDTEEATEGEWDDWSDSGDIIMAEDTSPEPKNTDPWIGTFKGTCPSYNWKDEYGQEIEIYGEKITMPPVSYIFEIFDNNKCTITMSSEGDSFSCYNVRYSVSSNYSNFVVTMKPQSGSDCGGVDIILSKEGSNYKIAKSKMGQPSYTVKKNN